MTAALISWTILQIENDIFFICKMAQLFGSVVGEGFHLNPDDAEDEEDKEAEEKDVTQHGQRVQQQHN